MSYEDPSRASSSGAVVAIVAVVVVLLLGGLLVLGLAGLFFFRLSAAQPVPVLEPPRAVVAERARMVEPPPAVETPAELPVPAPGQVVPPGALVRKLIIRLDAQGKIHAKGQSVDLGWLQDLLTKPLEDGTIRLDVVIEVDRQCLFEHVAAVQAVCQQAGVDNVRVQALTTSPD